jgi:hypothetical protein
VAVALQQDNYPAVINQSELTKVEIKKSKQIELLYEVLNEFLNTENIFDFQKSGTEIFSITVTGHQS